MDIIHRLGLDPWQAVMLAALLTWLVALTIIAKERSAKPKSPPAPKRFYPGDDAEGRYLASLHEEAHEVEPAHPRPFRPYTPDDGQEILDVAMRVDVASLVPHPRSVLGMEPARKPVSQIWCVHGEPHFVLVAGVADLHGAPITVHTVVDGARRYLAVVLSADDMQRARDGAIDIPDYFGVLWDRLL